MVLIYTYYHMTNISYVLFTALVMLLWITNLSVSYDIISTGYTVLWSDTIPKQNVWLLVGIQSHLFPFQQYMYATVRWGHKKSSDMASRKLVILCKGAWRDSIRITYYGLLRDPVMVICLMYIRKYLYVLRKVVYVLVRMY